MSTVSRLLRLSGRAVVALVASCAPSFYELRTPSGEYCADMPVIPAGQEPERAYHRLRPVASEPGVRTEAERLESLRKAACSVGGDAVIEAVNEEVKTEHGFYATVANGTAVIWRGEARRESPKPASPAQPPASAPAPASIDAPAPPPSRADDPRALLRARPARSAAADAGRRERQRGAP
jgi:hypothetical protein